MRYLNKVHEEPFTVELDPRTLSSKALNSITRNSSIRRDAWRNCDDQIIDLSEGQQKKDSNDNKGFSEESMSLTALLPVLWIAKLFGVVPLVISKRRIRFKNISISILIWALITASHGIYSLIRIITIFLSKEKSGSWVHSFQVCIFYVLGMSGSFLLLRMSKLFPKLMDKYSNIEREIGLRFLPTIRITIILVTVILMTSAVLETTASMFYRIQPNDTTEYWQFLEIYIEKRHQSIIEAFSYTRLIGMVILFINKHGTFVWNYLDLIIASAAISLNAIMRAFNKRVQEACFSASGGYDVDWTHLRKLHLDIFFLNEKTDNIFGYLICQSYLTNLFFILLQVYNGVRKIIAPSLEEVDSSMFDFFYLIWSFLHLFGRLVLVSMCCAHLQQSSFESLPLLLSLENSDYRYEKDIERLIHQVEKLRFGLTGVGYFSVSKTFMVKIFGSILTYEVILLQLGPNRV